MELWQLQQLQALPLEVKIRKTQERIKEWYEHYNGQVYVSFSGGKDSTVLLHIAREMYPDIEAVFADTGLEYPEIRDFVKGFDNVTWLKPRLNFKQVIEKCGYPIISKDTSKAICLTKRKIASGKPLTGVRESQLMNIDGKWKNSKFDKSKWKYLLDAPFDIGDGCCSEMKKIPMHKYEKQSGKHSILGTMADESVQRQAQWIRYGCNGFNLKNPSSKPISFWMEQDVLQFLKKFNISYCSVYGELVQADGIQGQISLEGTFEKLKTSGSNRTGCMFCMYGVHLEKSPNRFEMMKETHPKQYDYCINKLGLGGVLDYIGVKY